MMKVMMKQVKLAAAVVAGMFAFTAQAETYYLLGADPGKTSSITGLGSCAGWGTEIGGSQQKTTIEAGNTYILSGQVWWESCKNNSPIMFDERNTFDLRTPEGKDSQIPAGANFIFEGGRINLKNKGKTLTISNLEARKAKTLSVLNIGDDGKNGVPSIVTLAGENWVIDDEAILGFNATAEATSDAGRGFKIQPTISGSGTLLFYSNHTFLQTNNKIVGPCSFELNGNFAGFIGTLHFLGNDKFAATIANPNAFGAEPAALLTNVVLNSVKRETATKGITLKFDCDITTGPNRGWDFGSGKFTTTFDAVETTGGAFSTAVLKTNSFDIIQSTIEVADGKTLRIEGPITGTVGFNKTGTGTLVFAHPAFEDTPVTLVGETNITSEVLSNYIAQIEYWESSAGGNTLTLESYLWSGTTLSATLIREGGKPVDVYVCYGATNGGEDSAAWEHCEKLDVAFGVNEKSLAVAATLPKSAEYVSFFTSEDGWIDTLVIDELELTEKTALSISGMTEVHATCARFTGLISSLGKGAAQGTLYAYIKQGDEVEATKKEVLTVSADAESPVIDFFIYGLDADENYAVSFQLENDQGETSELSDKYTFTTLGRQQLSASVSGNDTTYLEKTFADTKEKVFVFTNGAKTATFTVTKAGSAEVLVVGGGGGGGTDSAGGGGAGGYQHFDNLYLPVGTYTITVGAGGAKGAADKAGAKGGDTTIAYSGEGTFASITAYGGGGGDERDNQRPQGTNFGSTGGAANKRDAKSDAALSTCYPVYGQGNYGGNGNPDSGYSAGGGGGAGTDGQSAYRVDATDIGGNGGDGLLCAISGELRYYAGGGGGCGNLGGNGGLGGGGRGYSTIGTVVGTDGVDGLGSGGGGGSKAKVNGVDGVLTSGKGGSGTVIIRFVPAADESDTTPTVRLLTLTPKNDDNGVPGVEVTYEVASEGVGDFVTADFEYSVNAVDYTAVRFADRAFVSVFTENVTGLRANTVYFGRMKVTDRANQVAYSRGLQFVTLDGDDSAVEPTAPRFTISSNTTNPDHRIEFALTGSNLVLDNGTTTVKLLAGTDPNALSEKAITVVSQTAAEIKVVSDDLDFDTAYFAAFVVDNGVAETRSPAFGLSIAGQSVLLRSTATTKNVNSIDFSGFVRSLGVGKTEAKLYVSQVNDKALELAQTITLTEPGEFKFETMTFDYNKTVYYRIDVVNTCGNSQLTTTGTAGNSAIGSDVTYLWQGADEGLWHDANNWRVVSDKGPLDGYPTYYSKARFPSNQDSKIRFDRSQQIRMLDWGFSNGTVAFSSVGETPFEVSIPQQYDFNFNGGKHANVIIDRLKIVGAGGNNHLTFGEGNTLTLTNGAEVVGSGNSSQLNLTAAANRLTVTHNSRLALANANHTLSGTGARIELLNGGTLEQYPGNSITLKGTDTAIVISNGTFKAANNVVFDVGNPKIVLAGEEPSIIGAGNIYANSGKTGRLEFMVPVDGYAQAPMRLTRAAGFNTDTGKGKIELAVPADAPAATAETDLDVVLVSATKITTTNFTLCDLPHPEDRWIWTKADGTEADNGDTVTGLKVHLVGRPSEPTAPVARGLHVKSSTDTSVTFEADFRRGGSSESATWSYKLDEADEWTTIEGAFDQVENVKELTIEGLEKGSKHTLHLKGVSADGVEGLTDYVFGTVGEVAELGTATGVTAEPYGPYTRFVANASSKGTFEVLVAHEAEIAFDGGAPTKFMLNSGDYTIDGLTFANEGGVLYSAPANAVSMTVRVQTAAVENEPVFGFAGITTDADGKVVVALEVVGFGGEVSSPDNPPTSFDAKLVWGYHPEHLVYEAELGAVSSKGAMNCANHLTLPESTLIYAKVVGDNGQNKGVAESPVFTYALPGAGEVGDGALYQAKSSLAWNTAAWNIFADATCRTRGPMAALRGDHLSERTWTDVDGAPCDNWDNNTTFGYVGYMRLAAGNMAFAAGIDDSCLVKVFPKDTSLSALTTTTPLLSYASLGGNGFKITDVLKNKPEDGWYPVEIRVGNATGTYGPWSATRVLRYCELGTGTTKPGETATNLREMLDSGEGLLFSTFVPKGATPEFDAEAPFVADLCLNAGQGVALGAVFTAKNAASFAFRTASTIDMANAEERAATAMAGEDGKTTLTLADLEPGEEFYVQVVAYAAEGEKCFATYPRKVIMPAASAFATDPAGASAQDVINITAAVKSGAGETWVLGEFTVDGETSEVVLDHWVNNGESEPHVINWSQKFEGAWNKAVSYKITLSNEVDAENRWTAVPIFGSRTITDTATYTWNAKGDVVAVWSDSSNWTCNQKSGIGYPTETSTAKFTLSDGADVVLDQDRTIKVPTIGANARVVFSGPHTVTIPSGDISLTGAGVTLGVKDGATLRHLATIFPKANDITLFADNATLHFNSFLADKSGMQNCQIRLSGASPKFITQSYLGGRTGVESVKILLTVPKAGWKEPVIVSNGTTQKKFGESDKTGVTTKFRFAIDPDSPFFSRGGSRNMVIVDWPYGFSAENLDLESTEKPKRARKCEFAFNDENPAAASLLKLRLAGYGLVFFIKQP